MGGVFGAGARRGQGGSPGGAFRASLRQCGPRSPSLVAFLAAPAAGNDYLRNRPKPKEGFRYPDCFCTLRGERVEIGEERCLRVDGRTFTARCDMAQNNTIWREVREGCDAQSS